MELRRHRAAPAMDDDEEHFERIGRPDSAGHTTALGMDLERAVATLPPRARAVLVLYDVEGWTHQEIATRLDMAIGPTKDQCHPARGPPQTRRGQHNEKR